MKGKEKVLLVCVVLYILLGCIIPNESTAYRTEETRFGSPTETLYHYGKIQEQEKTSFTKHILSFLTDTGDALRHIVQTKRTNHSSSSKWGASFIKKNYISYTLINYQNPTRNNASRLTETRKHLISLRKLII